MAVVVAVAVTGLGLEWIHAQTHGWGAGLRELVWSVPDDFSLGLIIITALAPMLASWRRGAAGTVIAEQVRRRRAMTWVGLFGAALMVALTHFDMALLRRAVDLGVERHGWNFGCMWPSGYPEAAFVGFGRLAVVLRIESAVIDALARDARSLGRRRQLWRIALACALAACAAAPFVWLGIEDYVASDFPRRWELPGLAYVVAFGLFEVLARLGLLGQSGPQSRRSTRPADPRSQASASQLGRQPQAKQRLAPDPAALALGHRALARARRWFSCGTIVGLLALAVLISVSGEQLLNAFEYHNELPLLVALIPICALSLVFVIFQPALEGETPAPLRPRLSSAGLERVVELLGQALALLERGHDQQFEELYFDFCARFETLEAKELELLATRGVDPKRLHSLPATWVDTQGDFDAELRRGIHRELSQIHATVIGQPSADPYRADLGACGLVDSIGLGWLRGGKARDVELGVTHRRRNVAVLAAVLAWGALAFAMAVPVPYAPLSICVPGVDGCRLAITSIDAAAAVITLLVLAPVMVWVIGVVHRCVARRCFMLALPSDANTQSQRSPRSPTFMSTLERLTQLRAIWFMGSLAGCWLMLATILISSVSASFGADAWLDQDIDIPGVWVLLGTLAGFALICLRPIRHGHRRACARLWLAWLKRRAGGDEHTVATLETLVRHRIELLTSSPPARESIEALLITVAAAPLPTNDSDAMLERLESALDRAVSLTRDDLLELDRQLWTCELWIAEPGAHLH